MGWGFHHHNHHRHHGRRHGGEDGMRGERGCGPRGGGWNRRFFDQMAQAMEQGGGRGRRRMFDGSELRLILLKLIAEQPRHGYDLIREIEERSGGAYAPSPGVVYPTLSLLDEMDLIEEHKAEGAKKQFGITAAGTAHLEERAEEVQALFDRLAELGSMRERANGGPVRRAMGNLRTALHDRLANGDPNPETLHEIAEILDEAVRRIERL
jgi:DNA-binding PadR family transcriptional regulator